MTSDRGEPESPTVGAASGAPGRSRETTEAPPPFVGHVGLKVESANAGTARLRLPWNPEHTQEAAVLQGGYVALLADAAVYAAAHTLLKPGEALTTIELKTNFLAPVRGQDVIAEASIVKRGRTIVLGEVSLRVPSGELVGKSLVTYMVLPPRAPADTQRPSS